jgi:hypothetical protein
MENTPWLKLILVGVTLGSGNVWGSLSKIGPALQPALSVAAVSVASTAVTALEQLFLKAISSGTMSPKVYADWLVTQGRQDDALKWMFNQLDIEKIYLPDIWNWLIQKGQSTFVYKHILHQIEISPGILTEPTMAAIVYLLERGKCVEVSQILQFKLDEAAVKESEKEYKDQTGYLTKIVQEEPHQISNYADHIEELIRRDHASMILIKAYSKKLIESNQRYRLRELLRDSLKNTTSLQKFIWILEFNNFSTDRSAIQSTFVLEEVLAIKLYFYQWLLKTGLIGSGTHLSGDNSI